MLANSQAYSGFAVPDLAEARRFYGETLGLNVSGQEDDGVLSLDSPGAGRARLRQARPHPGDLHDPQLPGRGRRGDGRRPHRARRASSSTRASNRTRKASTAARAADRLVPRPRRQHPVGPRAGLSRGPPMRCDPPAADRLPPQVAAMLAATGPWPPSGRPTGAASDGYARAQPYARWLGTRLLAAVFSMRLDDWPGTVRACLTDPLPAGLVVATLDAAGVGLRAGPVPYLLDGARPRWPCCSTPAWGGDPGRGRRHPGAGRGGRGRAGRPHRDGAGPIEVVVRAGAGAGDHGRPGRRGRAGRRARLRLRARRAEPLVGGGRPRRRLVP